MSFAAILGDSTAQTPGNTHSITAPATMSTVTVGGIPIAVVNGYIDNTHTHPSSNGAVLTPFSLSTGSLSVTAGGFPVHRIGDSWSCGDATDLPVGPRTVTVGG